MEPASLAIPQLRHSVFLLQLGAIHSLLLGLGGQSHLRAESTGVWKCRNAGGFPRGDCVVSEHHVFGGLCGGAREPRPHIVGSNGFTQTAMTTFDAGYILRLAICILPVLGFLGALVLLDSFKLAP